MPRAYVSSTYEDLKEHREAVRHVLNRARYEYISSLQDLSSHQLFSNTIAQALDDLARCDVYIGVIGWRYGFIPKQQNPQELSVTEFEYRQAVELGKPRLIFLVDSKVKWPAGLRDQDPSRIENFRNRLLSSTLCWFFTTPQSLAQQLSERLESLPGERSSPRREPRFREMSRRLEELASSPEGIARLLATIALRDRSRLALLESPTTADLADYLRDQKVDRPLAFLELLDQLGNDTGFEPDLLWLSWITQIHGERLREIGDHLSTTYSLRFE